MAEHSFSTPPWQPGFARLGGQFVTHLPPQPLSTPYWIAHSGAAARDLGLDTAWLRSNDALLLFSGNALPEGARPWSSVYSGHQFGVWAGQLGDGRALTLGALPDRDGVPQEIQLKGSGLTPYSRMGDGRAVLRSSLREFVASEAMHALGVPTTRALCLAGSPDPVYRETVETAAVVTRFAPSFVRFGHFEHFAARRQLDALRALTDYELAQFYPRCQEAANPYAAMLQEIAERTADLLAHWQTLGFCHGVMNTDNMSVLGLTIDYGPYQFLDAYDPGHICNHSDQQGRYAYDRQPDIALWNLYALGQAMLPLIDDTHLAKAAVDSFAPRFHAALASRWAAKLGLNDTAAASALAGRALDLLERHQIDFTAFWRRLSLSVPGNYALVRALLPQPDALDAWLTDYDQARRQHALPDAGAAMLATNPAVVPRNHLCQTAIAAAEGGNFEPLHQLFAACTTPFSREWDEHPYAGLPPAWAVDIAISCSS